MKELVNAAGRMTPAEMAETAREWVAQNERASNEARAKLKELLTVGPLHTSLLSEIRDEFDIPKPISAWVRLWNEFSYFSGKLDSPNGQPAVALTAEKDNPAYWRKFRKSLIPNSDDSMSPWIRLGIPSAATVCGPVRMEAFCALLRNINPEGDRWLLMAEVCAEFQKTAGMRFQDFFQGRKPGEVSNDFDGQQYCLWQWSEHRPPLLSVQRKDRINRTPLQALTATALKTLRRAARTKSPEMIDFDELALKYKVDKESVYFAYLKELGVALEPQNLTTPATDVMSSCASVGQVKTTRRKTLPEKVRGVVQELNPSGVIVDVNGLSAWLPLSELAWDFVADPHDVVQAGCEYEFVIIPDRDNEGRLIVSLKRTTKDPWLTAAVMFAKGSVVDGVVTRYTMNDDGVVVSLAPGITGFLPLREMPPQIRKDTASASIDKNTRIRVAVIGMDREQRKILLSMKQVESALRVLNHDRYVGSETRKDDIAATRSRSEFLMAFFGTGSPSIMDVWREFYADPGLVADASGNVPNERLIVRTDYTFSIVRRDNGVRYSVYVTHTDRDSFATGNRKWAEEYGWLKTSDEPGRWCHLIDVVDPEVSELVKKRNRSQSTSGSHR